MDNICDSCGMPMTTREDFGGGDEKNLYCVHCTDSEGNLKTFEEVLEGLTYFVMDMMNEFEENARVSDVLREPGEMQA